MRETTQSGTAIPSMGTLTSVLGESMLDPAALAELTPKRSAVPESLRRLMHDVLLDAIIEAEKPAVSVRQLRMRCDARTWLSECEAPFTVRDCCDALGISYECLIKRLRARWQQGTRARKQKHDYRGAGRQRVTMNGGGAA